MNHKVKGMLMQLPAMLILVILVIGSFYIQLAKIEVGGETTSWATPITILVIVGLYFWGRVVEMESSHSQF